jgi:hypothetical protein
MPFGRRLATLMSMAAGALARPPAVARNEKLSAPVKPVNGL